MFYLDHEERVKFVDGVLAHSQEWQWLIDIIGEKAEFKDIDSWGDFVNERIQLQTIYEYFVKILSFCDREWEWPQVQIQQLWLIAQFRHDKYGGMRAGYHRYILHAFSFLCMDHQIGKCG